LGFGLSLIVDLAVAVKASKEGEFLWLREARIGAAKPENLQPANAGVRL
jgi:hypothetical protein